MLRLDAADKLHRVNKTRRARRDSDLHLLAGYYLAISDDVECSRNNLRFGLARDSGEPHFEFQNVLFISGEWSITCGGCD